MSASNLKFRPAPAELEAPVATNICDIETRVLQSLVAQTLSTIPGIALLEGTLIDDLLNRGGIEGYKGIFVEQNPEKNTLNVKVELNVAYGVVLPNKAEEIQERVAESLTKFTGFHVSMVHVVFKNLINPSKTFNPTTPYAATLEDEYTL
jgi:Uncharacterized protein conserved in bacteria